MAENDRSSKDQKERMSNSLSSAAQKAEHAVLRGMKPNDNGDIEPVKSPSLKTDENLSFGMVDLGVEEASGVEVEKREPKPPRPAAPKESSNKPFQPQKAASLGSAQSVRQKSSMVQPSLTSPQKQSRPPVEIKVPHRSYAREYKIIGFILGICALIALGIFGVLKWQESAQKEKEEFDRKLNEQSRDSLLDDAIKKEKISP